MKPNHRRARLVQGRPLPECLVENSPPSNVPHTFPDDDEYVDTFILLTTVKDFFLLIFTPPFTARFALRDSCLVSSRRSRTRLIVLFARVRLPLFLHYQPLIPLP